MPTALAAGSGESLRLRLQGLPAQTRVLAVGALAALSADNGTFSTRQVADLMSELRLPPIANLSDALSRLRQQDVLMRPSRNVWALTPKGVAYLDVSASNVPVQALASDLGRAPGSDFGDRQHTLIPPFLGPMGAAPGLTRILSDSAFEQNVMLITRFPRGIEDHFAQLILKLRGATAAHGLKLQVASDGMAEDTLWANVVTYMWACKYAIVLMDSADGVLNSNVLIEIGGMLMTGRRCAILRDKSVPAMPSDLVGHIYKSADLADHNSSVAAIHQWIRDDLGLAACADCPSTELPAQR
ncbi:hypothetical protein [Mycobacterium sp. NPDC006124]|uniref:hypothetical protein n=1 Tax=Mycobacterium sp. NPDC006124 TaxID=3156729 RepID=UPI0033A1BF13